MFFVQQQLYPAMVGLWAHTPEKKRQQSRQNHANSFIYNTMECARGPDSAKDAHRKTLFVVFSDFETTDEVSQMSFRVSRE